VTELVLIAGSILCFRQSPSAPGRTALAGLAVHRSNADKTSSGTPAENLVRPALSFLFAQLVDEGSQPRAGRGFSASQISSDLIDLPVQRNKKWVMEFAIAVVGTRSRCHDLDRHSFRPGAIRSVQLSGVRDAIACSNEVPGFTTASEVPGTIAARLLWRRAARSITLKSHNERKENSAGPEPGAGVLSFILTPEFALADSNETWAVVA
jgi:hypothetical protein